MRARRKPGTYRARTAQHTPRPARHHPHHVRVIVCLVDWVPFAQKIMTPQKTTPLSTLKTRNAALTNAVEVIIGVAVLLIILTAAFFPTGYIVFLVVAYDL